MSLAGLPPPPETTLCVMTCYLSLLFVRLGAHQELPAHVSVHRYRRQALLDGENLRLSKTRLAAQGQELVRFEAHPHVRLRVAQLLVGMTSVVDDQQLAAG